MSRFLRSLAVVMVAHLCLLLPVSAGAAGDPLPSPPLLVHNATLIAASRARITARDPAALLAAAAAERWAEESLSLGPWSVTQCPHPPPSGDAHAYYSIAKYYWPCNGRPVGCNAAPAACNASGLPWVDCDGLVNPITNEFALPRVANFTSTLAVLAAGFTWTGRVDFAERAAVLVRAWFLDAATRMLPNMAFAQAEPGSNDGSHWGIIELSTNFVAAVLDSVALIAPSGAWTAADHAQLLSWLRDFDAWLRDSALGQQEYGAAPPDIARGGQLPAEEARTNSAGYVNFASLALLQLGLLARSPLVVAAGAPDLLSYVTHSNQTSIREAVDFMVPFVLGEAAWPFQNLTRTPWSTFAGEYRIAANLAGWEDGRELYRGVVARIGGADVDPTSLFWPTAW